MHLNHTQGNSLPKRAKAKNAQKWQRKEEHLGNKEFHGEGARGKEEGGRLEATLAPRCRFEGFWLH
jgi:hypothetical protein